MSDSDLAHTLDDVVTHPNPEKKVPIGLRIKLKRIERGVLQRRVALDTGIHPATLSEIENSWRLPNSKQLDRIAAAIGVPTEELRSGVCGFCGKRDNLCERCGKMKESHILRYCETCLEELNHGG